MCRLIPRQPSFSKKGAQNYSIIFRYPMVFLFAENTLKR